MARVIFFDKSGCAGNARQKQLLLDSGHLVLARDLRNKAWSNHELLKFLAGLPVTDWFNPQAPAIKAREIVPAELDEPTALALLRENPLLIRRPLLQVEEERLVGFDAAAIHALIGLDPFPADDPGACRHPHDKPVTYAQGSGGAIACHFGAADHAGDCGSH